MDSWKDSGTIPEKLPNHSAVSHGFRKDSGTIPEKLPNHSAVSHGFRKDGFRNDSGKIA